MTQENTTTQPIPGEQPQKRRRGRPPKKRLPEQTAALPTTGALSHPSQPVAQQDKNTSDPANIVSTPAQESSTPVEPPPPTIKIISQPTDKSLPMTLGMILQQARHQQHLKLSSVAKKLCIKEIYLDALEHGHYYAFPALAYGIGFLRAYAHFLNLDADEMVSRFYQETDSIKSEPVDLPRPTDAKILPDWKIAVKALIALFVLYLIWNIYQAMTDTPAPEIPLPEVENQIVIGEIDMEAPVTSDEIQLPTLPAEPEIKPIVTETKPVPQPQPSAPAPKGQSYGLKKPARVSFVATGKTKIEILDTDADSVLFQKTLEAGDRYNPIEQSDGMVLKTDNAGSLDIYIDGKKIRTLGKKNQAKNGVSLKADDLLKD